MNSAARKGLEALLAALLLAVGFGACVALIYGIGLATGGFEGKDPAAEIELLAIYYRVILVKGLVPQLLLALVLWPLGDRLVPRAWSGAKRIAAGLVPSALVAWLALTPLLLTRGQPGWPAFRMTSPSQWMGTAVLSVLAIVAASWAARRLLHTSLSLS